MPSASNSPVPLDRHDLYELCAQSPARDAKILSAIHGGKPRRLGEDFCATAALSRAWAGLSPRHRAVAVDHDAEVLARAKPHPRVRLVHADVLKSRDKADIIAVFNYSIGELHTRRLLVRYLKHARTRLGVSGCFVCDIYGGSDAMFTGVVRRAVRGPRGESIRYSWEQRLADPLTGRVVNAMHFHVRPRRGKAVRYDDAFIYDWRLWSVPELREAMADAGFASSEVIDRTPGAIDSLGGFHVTPIEDPAEIGDSFSLYVVARCR